MMSSDLSEQAITETAIEWMVEISSGEMSEQQYQSFERWLASDPRHERVWIKLQEGLMPFGVANRGGLSINLVLRRLSRRSTTRRNILLGLAGVFTGATGLALTNRYFPLSVITADELTSTGEQRFVQTPDGSEVTMGPRTAFNHLAPPKDRAADRGIELLQGEILVRVARSGAPFRLAATGVKLSSSEGTFAAAIRGQTIELTGISGEAQVEAAARYTLAGGEQLAFREPTPERRTIDPKIAASWAEGILIAKDQELGEVLERLRPYVLAHIDLDPAVARRKVTAVIQLSRPEEALQALASSLDLTLWNLSSYWISIQRTTA